MYVYILALQTSDRRGQTRSSEGQVHFELTMRDAWITGLCAASPAGTRSVRMDATNLYLLSYILKWTRSWGRPRPPEAGPPAGGIAL